MPSRASTFNIDDPEISMVNKLTAMWANFARFGKPITNKLQKMYHVTWSPANATIQNYLEIGDDLTVRNEMFRYRNALWERLFPLGPATVCDV